MCTNIKFWYKSGYMGETGCMGAHYQAQAELGT